MLPKINTNSMSDAKTENIAAKIIIEDHLKTMLAKSENINYKPWKNGYAPKNPQSPFGDFPKEYISKTIKQEKKGPIYEVSQASTTISNVYYIYTKINIF